LKTQFRHFFRHFIDYFTELSTLWYKYYNSLIINARIYKVSRTSAISALAFFCSLRAQKKAKAEIAARTCFRTTKLIISLLQTSLINFHIHIVLFQRFSEIMIACIIWFCTKIDIIMLFRLQDGFNACRRRHTNWAWR
jgi:hypothetical protein